MRTGCAAILAVSLMLVSTASGAVLSVSVDTGGGFWGYPGGSETWFPAQSGWIGTGFVNVYGAGPNVLSWTNGTQNVTLTVIDPNYSELRTSQGDNGGYPNLQPVAYYASGTSLGPMFDSAFRFGQYGTCAGTFEVTGLTANGSYDIDAWSWAASGGNGVSIYDSIGGTLLGSTTISNVAVDDLTDTTGKATISGLTADATGKVTFAVSGYQGMLNGFELTPEPATLSLLALGGLALIRRKRS